MQASVKAFWKPSKLLKVLLIDFSSSPVGLPPAAGAIDFQ